MANDKQTKLKREVSPIHHHDLVHFCRIYLDIAFFYAFSYQFSYAELLLLLKAVALRNYFLLSLSILIIFNFSFSTLFLFENFDFRKVNSDNCHGRP